MLTYWLLGCEKLSLVKKKQSQVASFATSLKAMYLGFINDSANIDCLFKRKLIKPPLNINIKTNVYFQLSLLPA